ncbi:MAG: hypothetical protein ACKVOD_11065 [Flavobacterium sp.]
MWGTLKVFPPYANTPVAVQLCNDAEMMAWLLIPVWESFGEQWFLADQQALFLRSKPNQ